MLGKKKSSEDIRIMTTNPQAMGQTKISFQISEAEKDVLQKLADQSGMKLSAYVRKVLAEAMETGTAYTQSKITTAPFAALAAEDPAPYKTKPRPKRGNDQAS